jgi:hypothetical protein
MKTTLKKLTGIATLALFAGTGTNAFSQLACDGGNYNMQAKSVINCTSLIYDSGGPSSNYGNNQDYTFTISPIDATSITLVFTETTNIETNYDYLDIFDDLTGTTPLYHITGNVLPSPITISGAGKLMRLKFHSDASVVGTGFKAYWTTLGGSCGDAYNMSASVISAKGTLYDSGGPSGNYGNNENKTFNIQPTNATSVCISFSQFNTEANYDLLKIYNDVNGGGSLLATYSGTSLPSNVTSNTGKMSLIFTSDASVVSSGFKAVWTSDGDYPAFMKNVEARTITSDDVTNATPVSIFPNPANSMVTIGFDVQQEGAAKIVVYNAAGVETIVLNETLASGKHNINFDASGLASGIYFCKVITAGSVQVEKLIKN